MMKTKTTRHTLVMSTISLILCVAMLVGTTFAWFTDNVTSTGNKIVSGTLDVQLWMHNGTDYEDISNSTSPIFGSGSIAQNNNAETLWEPGKTQVAYLAINNGGNLDLKYTVKLNVKNVSKNLYEVMKYAIVPDARPDSSPVTAWTSGNSVVEGNQSVSGDVSLAADTTHYFALVIHMDEEAGNTYQDGEVNFDMTVLATQLASEEDSFDNTYDNKAVYEEDVQVNEQPWHELDAVQTDTVVDGGGYTYAADYQEVALVADADLTIKGVTFQNGLTVYTDYDASGTIRLEDCTIYLNDGNGNPSNSALTQFRADHNLIIGAISPNVTWEFVNCKFKAYDNHTYTNTSSYNAYIFGNYSAESISFEGCTFEGSGKHAIGCSYSYGPNQDTIPFTYYNLNVTGCNFVNWNNCSTMGGNGAAIRGNVPADVLTTFKKSINISGNTFGESNGSTQATVAIDGWTGTWN